MTGYHTRWVRPPEQSEDPERIAIREALAFGKAVYDQRRALGLSVADLAGRAEMTADEIEWIEEGGTEPTIALLRRLAAALDADVRLTAGARSWIGVVRTARNLSLGATRKAHSYRIGCVAFLHTDALPWMSRTDGNRQFRLAARIGERRMPICVARNRAGSIAVCRVTGERIGIGSVALEPVSGQEPGRAASTRGPASRADVVIVQGARLIPFRVLTRGPRADTPGSPGSSAITGRYGPGRVFFR